METTPSASKIISSLSNDKLRNLLKELKKIGNSDMPKYAIQTTDMASLFETYQQEYQWAAFYDTYSNITNLINYEILNRIVIDKF